MGLLSALASDRWAAGTGLVSALAILPLPAHAHSPELAAALAVAAVAVLAGHRWALGALILAEVFLVAAVWPAAFLARPPSALAQLAVGVAALGAVPGLVRLLRGGDEVLDTFDVPARWRPALGRVLLAGAAVVWMWPAVGPA